MDLIDPSTPKDDFKEEAATVDVPKVDLDTDFVEDAKTAAVSSLSSAKVEQYVEQVLDFLSKASNETLGACIAALCAITYFILGRVGLLLIGAVGGVALHATWQYNGQKEQNVSSTTTESRRRKEVSLDIVKRVMDWRQIHVSIDTNDETADTKAAIGSSADPISGYEGFQPSTGLALTGLTDAVIREYVKWWYGPLLPSEESFPSTCRQTLIKFILNFSSHLSRKRPADTFVDFLTNTSSIVIVFIDELSAALMAPGAISLDSSEALYRYLEETPDGHLASVTDEEEQNKKFKAVAGDILANFLDAKSYTCEPVRVFLQEVLAGLVLTMTVQSCSRPEFLNGWIVYLLEEADTELIDAIDAGVGGATANGATKLPSQLSGNGASRKPILTDNANFSEDRSRSEHKRTVSKAEDAMEEAMQEAKRLTELIAAEEARRNREASGTADDAASSSGTMTANDPTPTSSESDLAASTYTLENNLVDSPLPASSATAAPSFTTFDQILPNQPATALQANSHYNIPVVPALTLHNASIFILDDEQPGEKATLRSKPTVDYLIQVEPPTSQHPGWMIPRKYSDFETLHEVLRRISVISGVDAFAEGHSTIPTWKNRTKAALRGDLEHYLRDALSFSRLAESEGMKRFLEKEQGLSRSSPSTKQGAFGFPSPAAFETMGKGMLDVLSSAPRGAASGGKAVVGGFTGVLGLGQKKAPSTGNPPAGRSISRSGSSLSRMTSADSVAQSRGTRQSYDSLQNTNGTQSEASEIPELPDRPKYIPQKMEDGHVLPAEKVDDTPTSTPPKQPIDQADIHLPPPPSEIPDDYNTFGITTSPTSSSLLDPATQPQESLPPSKAPSTTRPPPLPLSETETRITIELFFALLTELYTLSSAWSIRLTLLGAAKTYLLRPGNPSLTSIRSLIQDTIIDAQTSDTGIAAHINKIRENVLPTEEERKKWPNEMTEEEKERLRAKARRLLVEKGVPAAVRGVVGQAATGEAMGRVFDSLQVEKVARGFVFALVVQAIKALAQ